MWQNLVIYGNIAELSSIQQYSRIWQYIIKQQNLAKLGGFKVFTSILNN